MTIIVIAWNPKQSEIGMVAGGHLLWRDSSLPQGFTTMAIFVCWDSKWATRSPYLKA